MKNFSPNSSMQRASGKRLLIVEVLFVLLSLTPCSAQSGREHVLPKSSRQLILVLSDSWSASKGFLFRFERKSPQDPWQESSSKTPVVLGRNGMAWGRGLHSLDSTMIPVKKEGDGKTPAGIFTLGTVFGRAPQDSMQDLKVSYLHVSKLLQCVDDPRSAYYNQFVLQDTVKKTDWNSSEQMAHYGIWYNLGVVIDHNKKPILKGAGSCIFLHNWSRPDETSSGCTEVAPAELKKIVHWLNAGEHPLIVQLPFNEYKKYCQQWHLPFLKR